MSTISTASRMGQPEEPHGTSAALPHHAVNYYLIFAPLIVLTVITVGVAAAFRFQNELVNVLIALLIATIKATFVVRYFMHLKFEGKLIFLILLVPIGLTFILVFALIPDIGRGRHTAFNDAIGSFERAMLGSEK